MGQLELLAPAGSYETLKAVVNAGADAVYVGGSLFGARAYADNFTNEELLEGIRYCHLHGRRIYLTVNTLLKTRELEEQLYDYLLPGFEAGLDGVIVQDMGVVRFIQSVFPELPLHASTQMTVTNADGARLLKEQGVSRVVLARELSMEEIRQIRNRSGVELECFIHGALCYCYSGQCLMSSMLGGRSGNRGRCAQPCRLPYTVYGPSGRPVGEPELPVLSLKDFCTVKQLYELADCGVYSFKIEGRMKSPEYAAGVVSIYRKYMDSYLDGSRIPVADSDWQALLELGNRGGFTHGYLMKQGGKDMLSGRSASHNKTDGMLQEQVRNRYILREIKENIHGKLILCKEKPAMIQVTDGVRRITCEGDTVMQAQKQPLSPETVKDKICKTGGTPFVFDTLELELEPDVFLPVNRLNALRRDALERLEEAVLEPYRRQSAACGQRLRRLLQEAAHEQADSNSPAHVVSIERPEYLQELLARPWISRIYLDSLGYGREDFLQRLEADAEKTAAGGKDAYFIFPRIFRRRTEEFYETVIAEMKRLPLTGFVIPSLDVLGFAERHGLLAGKWDIVGESNLYTFNDMAADWYYARGIRRDTFPAELNRKELSARRKGCSELIVYGRQHLMLTAQCLHKNTAGCDRKPGMMELSDRMKVRFPVRNHCPDCCNVIYNSRTLCLLKEAQALQEIAPASYRIAFTLEDPGEMNRILSLYEETMILHRIPEDGAFPENYTNGHFKRGVE